MIKTILNRLADPKRGAYDTYAIPSAFMGDALRFREDNAYVADAAYEHAFHRMNSPDLASSMGQRQSFIYRAEPRSGDYIPNGEAQIAITDFSGGMLAKRHGASILITATAHHQSDMAIDRTLFGATGFFSEDESQFHIHKLLLPEFQGTQLTGTKDLVIMKDHDVMTGFAFAREMARQIFEDGETPRFPNIAWLDEQEKNYSRINPLWELDTASAKQTQPEDSPVKSALRRASLASGSYAVTGRTIADIFKRDALLFRNAPEFHYPVLALMGAHDHTKGSNYTEEHPEIAKKYLVHPDRTVAGQNYGQDRADRIESSAAIIYTEYPMTHGRTGFAAMIRDQIIDHGDRRHKCVKFGIHGVFNPDGMYEIKKIMLPGDILGKKSGRNDLHPVPLDETSIKGALYYAKLCADQLYDKKPLTAEYNFEQSVSEIDTAPPVGVRKMEL